MTWRPLRQVKLKFLTLVFMMPSMTDVGTAFVTRRERTAILLGLEVTRSEQALCVRV